MKQQLQLQAQAQAQPSILGYYNSTSTTGSKNIRLIMWYILLFLVVLVNRERLVRRLLFVQLQITGQQQQEQSIPIPKTYPTYDGCYCIATAESDVERIYDSGDTNDNNNLTSSTSSTSSMTRKTLSLTLSSTQTKQQQPNTTTTCPLVNKPNVTYSSEYLQQLKQQYQWLNPITISCDPYTNSTCNTNEYSLPIIQPNIQYNCVIDIFHTNTNTTTSTNYSYMTRTFQGSVQEAQNLGLYVTHTGPCGMCSNLNDLSVYIDNALTLRQLSTICGFVGITSKNLGIQCFQKLIGFTIGCSQIWYYNTVNTRTKCSHCFYHTLVGTPLQYYKKKHCPMNKCLQCDENKSGPNFSKFAGRNRRNSGILTDIVRNCTAFQSQLQHHTIVPSLSLS